MKRSQVCLYSLLGPKFPVSGDKDAFYPSGTGRVLFHMGDLFPAFRVTKEVQSTFFYWLSLK